MNLPAGRRVGTYEILAPIGAGGMGEVYRARDTKLDRDVALKVLPLRALDDDVAKARLVREAKLAASLNHPAICTIHDVGELDSVMYVAMELVGGSSLADLIPPGGLPPDQVLRLGRAIADAVAHAHEQSVVHRDLKCANIQATPTGGARFSTSASPRARRSPSSRPARRRAWTRPASSPARCRTCRRRRCAA